MFQKFAKLDVLEVKGAANRQRSASLSKLADYDDYRTDDGYMYVRVRAISSRVNKNHDGWPSEELSKSYKTFLGKPIFVDHHNHDPQKARGVIVDAALHIEDGKQSALDPYYSSAPANHLPPTWIELLLEVDAKKFPKLAKAVVDGDIDGVSMGANVELSKCSHCGNEARSPEQYCKHVQSKGAYFDFYTPDGQKTSKKSYEDCYDIGFFEISFVFDPADETALVSDMRTAKIAAIRAEADNMPPRPQSEMTTAPEEVNTLRQEQQCPICGSDMEDGVCEVCNYEEPPEGFQNPDLDKAKQTDQQEAQDQAQQAAQQEVPGATPPPPGGPGAQPPVPTGATPGQPPVMSYTTGSFTSSTSNSASNVTVTFEPRTSAQNGRVNTQERPILPATRQLSDKPIGTKTVSEAKKPVESNRKENMTDTIKTADGATPQGDGVQADKRVDVEGVGAVTGDPLSGIEHVNVEKETGGFTAPHTDTWSGDEGDSLGQHDPVSSETGDLFTVSSEKIAACDCCDDCPDCKHHEGDKESSTKTADTSGDLGGPTGEAVGDGGSAKVEGLSWDDPGNGFPFEQKPTRVELNAPLKEEVGGPTETDSKEEFRSQKHTEPVTKGENANNLGGPIGTAVASAKAHMFKAMQVAEAEIALGLREASSKFERIAELEDASESELDATLKAYANVKTAGLKKAASATPKAAAAGRMPQFSKSAGFDISAHSVDDVDFGDSIF